MTFWLLTGAMTAAVFALATAIGSTLVAAAAPAIARRFEGRAPAVCAAWLFRLRVMPALLAVAIAFGVVLPTLLEFEPRNTEEATPATAILLAALGAALLMRAAWRGAAAWRATRRVSAEWRRRGRRLEQFDTPLPVYAIEEVFPTVAVIGVVRPALYIAERVLRECPDDEVRAMLHHECAHVTGRDNLKRLLMRACPDFGGSGLERAWARAAEEAADAAVVQVHPASAVELAQALIRVARLAPTPNAPALASAFYLGGSIESRVRRLVDPAPASPPRQDSGIVLVAAAFTVAVAVAAIVASAPGLHDAIEAAVHALP